MGREPGVQRRCPNLRQRRFHCRRGESNRSPTGNDEAPRRGGFVHFYKAAYKAARPYGPGRYLSPCRVSLALVDCGPAISANVALTRPRNAGSVTPVTLVLPLTSETSLS